MVEPGTPPAAEVSRSFFLCAYSYQNCDDAGADEVMFLLDHGSYATDRILPDAERLQGPSLLLASSYKLSSDDLARIRRLGDSHKKAQFSKAGRFGVGLNALYTT